MAQYVYINGVRYDISEAPTMEGAYESLDDWWEDEEEIIAVNYDRYRGRRKEDEGYCRQDAT